MAVLFKSPKVEITKLTSGASAPTSSATWEVISSEDIKQSSVEIATTAGENSTLMNDNGGIKESYTGAAQYAINFSTYSKIEDIVDADGVITDLFAIRITEKATSTGFQMDKAAVSVSVNYNDSDGATYAYVFNGLAPASGNTLKEYPIADDDDA